MYLKGTLTRGLLLSGAAVLIPAAAAALEALPVTLPAPAAIAAAVTAEQASPAAPPAAAALAEAPVPAALRALGVTAPEVEAFYAARGHAPFWLAPGAAWGEALLATLARAGEHGLPVSRYDPARLAALRGGDRAAAEAAFMKAYLDFGRDIASGVLEPRRADREIHIDPVRPGAGELLARLAGPAPADLFDLAPDSGEYARLVAELARVTDLVRAGTFGRPVPDGPSLRPGHRSERVALLRDKLRALGDVPADAPAAADPLVYDADLVEAVKRFQIRHALSPDGVVGPATVRAVNSATDGRLGQILVNLERIRWLHRDERERHIFVNQASFTMELLDGDRLVLESRVVVGKPGAETRTPEFIDMMDHMIVNPTWHVPVSIATKEILPRLQRDPTYLERNGYRLVPVGRDPVPDGVTSDYSQYSTRHFPFRIKQNPSEANALGRVKFMFPNQFAVYLHDTPQKRFFERDVRTYSHGCVRVQRAFDLAHALLEGQVADPAAAFEGWLAARRERRIDLVRPVKVYLTYRTVWVDRAGEIQFRGDVYGRDARVLAALEAAGVAVPR